MSSEDILTAIDGAIADWETSDDAMRWVPEGEAREDIVQGAGYGTEADMAARYRFSNIEGGRISVLSNGDGRSYLGRVGHFRAHLRAGQVRCSGPDCPLCGVAPSRPPFEIAEP